CCGYILDNALLKIINFVNVVGLRVAKYEVAQICLFLGVVLQSEVNSFWKLAHRFAGRRFYSWGACGVMEIIELRFVMFVHRKLVALWFDDEENTVIASG